MSNVWATVSAVAHVLRMFPPMDFLFEKRIGVVTMDLPHIISTYLTQGNQQECFRFSDWFSLQCLGPWMNHMPPVWWSNFRFMFLNESWYVGLTEWRGIFYWCLALLWSLYIAQMLPLSFLSHAFTLRLLFYFKYLILSYYSFLLCRIWCIWFVDLKH